MSPALTLLRALPRRPLRRSLLLRSYASAEFSIPVIDFSRFLNAKDDKEKVAAASEVVDALVEKGFMVGCLCPSFRTHTGRQDLPCFFFQVSERSWHPSVRPSSLVAWSLTLVVDPQLSS